MPLKRCSANNTTGWKWGDQGKCYTGPGAKKKAIRQGLAEGGGKLDAFVKELSEDDYQELISDSEVSFGQKVEIAYIKSKLV